MMELCCGKSKEIVKSILSQISQAIDDIFLWNKDITLANDYITETEGMKTLAATSMLLEAIGEGVKRIDTVTEGKFLNQRTEIPWSEIMGMRNHIAHGYFDIDEELIFDVVKNDLFQLKEAVEWLRKV